MDIVGILWVTSRKCITVAGASCLKREALDSGRLTELFKYRRNLLGIGAMEGERHALGICQTVFISDRTASRAKGCARSAWRDRNYPERWSVSARDVAREVC